MDIGKLNKKLAEWRGLCFHKWEVVDNTAAHPYSRCRKCLHCGKQYSTDTDVWDLPDCADGEVYFDESLDACFKHLVPEKISEVTFMYASNCVSCDIEGLDGNFFEGHVDAESIEEAWTKSALALCLAIEKLADRESA